MKTQNPKFLILLICFFAFSFTTATAQTYDPYAVQVINNLIANNGVDAIPNAPETWWNFTKWNDSIPKQLIEACFHYDEPPFPALFGEVSFEGLTTLQKLWCNFNKITKLNVKNCTGLLWLLCEDNFITELNVTNCTELEMLLCQNNLLTKLDATSCKKMQYLTCYNNKLTKLDLKNNLKLTHLLSADNYLSSLDVSFLINMENLQCYRNTLTKLDLTELKNVNVFIGNKQSVPLTLYENELGEYTRSILLNNPTFGNSAISYWDEVLKSIDNTVASTSFSVQTGKPGFELSGTMNFTYSNVGVKTQEKIKLKVYPNPVNDILFIEGENFNTIKLYDMLGREMLCKNGNNKTEINISHLSKGIYIVAIFSEGKLMGNTKIVKQ